MFNSIKKTTSKYTGLLIRIDDIAENMNWKLMDKTEKLFDKLDIKPLLGVIPDNKDVELKKYSNNTDFWKRVKDWQAKGWEISMHGHSHVYNQQTKKDYFNYGGPSEFYGLKYDEQLNKIALGLKKFRDNNIKIRSFFAPNHTYDLNTFKALSNSDIKIVIDGYGLFPFNKFDLFFIPQLFYREIFLPIGIQSTQIHLNYWDQDYFTKFENFIEKYKRNIVDLNYILTLNESNLFKNMINSSIEKTLKIIRALR